MSVFQILRVLCGLVRNYYNTKWEFSLLKNINLIEIRNYFRMLTKKHKFVFTNPPDAVKTMLTLNSLNTV